ncbi:MAG: cupredoxin domain-containing protein [Bryobacterales bacterium]|nr:cupredoxin domain-containing protein [Bryobacterales bacterium]
MTRTACLFLAAALAISSGAQLDGRRPDRVINITAERFNFSPSRIKVKQGALVELVLASDDTDHGFRLPSAGIDVAIPQQGRGEARIRFVAREKGEFAFECSRPCGAGHNLMRGTIIVE